MYLHLQLVTVIVYWKLLWQCDFVYLSSSVSTSDFLSEIAFGNVIVYWQLPLVMHFVYLHLQLVPVIVNWKLPLVMRLCVSSSSVSTSDCLLEAVFGNVTLCIFIFS